MRSALAVHLELSFVNCDHFVTKGGQVRRSLVAMHSDGQPRIEWELFRSDLHVATIVHHYVSRIKCLVITVIILVGLEDERALNDNEFELWHCGHIDKKVLSARHLDSLTFKRWRIVTPSLLVAPAGDVAIDQASSGNIADACDMDLELGLAWGVWLVCCSANNFSASL